MVKIILSQMGETIYKETIGNNDSCDYKVNFLRFTVLIMGRFFSNFSYTKRRLWILKSGKSDTKL